MSNRIMSLKRLHVDGVEYLGDHPNILMKPYRKTICNSDPSRLLPAMLQGEQTKKRHTSDILIWRKNSYNAAFVMRVIINIPMGQSGFFHGCKV